MATRSELMQRLSVLSTRELLPLLRDDTIIELASRYFNFGAEMTSAAPVHQIALNTFNTLDPNTCDKAKRPLNAFMAFRSYYIKVFPELPQKAASGFLTTLWNKDPFRLKWSLVAKVYSLIRDNVGKDKMSLAYFLSFACPIMGIPRPSSYLSALGWSVQDDETSQRLVQDESIAAVEKEKHQFSRVPVTEDELVDALSIGGYTTERGLNLKEQLKTSSSGVTATPHPGFGLPIHHCTPAKLHFMNTVRTDPVQATKELLGDVYDGQTMQMLGVKSHEVNDLNSINHLPMQTNLPDPRLFYNYSNSQSQLSGNCAPIMNFARIPDHETFDIDSPWDVDALMGQTQTEGQRTVMHPKSPRHDTQEDFHYTFG